MRLSFRMSLSDTCYTDDVSGRPLVNDLSCKFRDDNLNFSGAKAHFFC
jgi:hypothetical protein